MGQQQAPQAHPQATRRRALSLGHEHAHRHKAQPKPRLPQRQGLPHADHRSHRQPQAQARPTPATPPQRHHQTKHQHRALGRQAPATEQGIGQGRPGAQGPSRQRGGPAQAPPPAPAIGPAPPSPHTPHAQCRPSGDVQTRNAHQVRHASGAKQLPIARANGGLIAHQQGQGHPHRWRSQRGRWQRRLPAVTQAFAPSLQPHPGLHRPLGGVPRPGRRQTLRHGVVAARADPSPAPHLVRPGAQLHIVAQRIEHPMGRLHPHRPRPNLAHPRWAGWLVVAWRVRHRDPQPRGELHAWATVEPVGRMRGQHEPPAPRAGLRQADHLALHPQSMPLHLGRQLLLGLGQRPRIGPRPSPCAHPRRGMHTGHQTTPHPLPPAPAARRQTRAPSRPGRPAPQAPQHPQPTQASHALDQRRMRQVGL